MKKILLGTSALVAVGLVIVSAGTASAADPLKLSVGGHIVQWVGGGNSDNKTTAGKDTTAYASTNFFTDNALAFKGSTTLDNGIKVTAILSRDGSSAALATWDSYAKFTSDKLGDLRFGILRGPEDTLAHMAPDVGIGNGGGDYSQFVNDTCSNCIDRTSGSSNTAHGRANSLVYYTPRIGGAGIGVSYGVNTKVDDHGLRDNMVARTGNVGSAAFVYEADVAGVGVGFDIGYTNNNNDYIQTSSGLNLSMNGFTLGGSWGRQRAPRGSTPTSWLPQSRMWDVGASYETGPYSVSLSYSDTTAEQSKTDRRTDERKVVVGSVSYAVGAGLDLKGSVFHIKSTDAASVVNNEDSAVGAAVGIELGF